MEAKTSLIRLRGIEKRFVVGSHEVFALRNLDLDVQPAELIALMGASGSGKSTLLNILGLMETPSRGTIDFLGHPVAGWGDAQLTRMRRGSVGFIFQNFNLLPVLSALENVEYPLIMTNTMKRRQIRSAAMQMLEAVGLAAFVDHRPGQLSGGQRQRVAIARALVKKPALILADEPTANLDSVTAGQILEVIKAIRVNFGTTTVVATHDPNVAAIAQRIVRMRDGAVVEPPELVKVAPQSAA